MQLGALNECMPSADLSVFFCEMETFFKKMFSIIRSCKTLQFELGVYLAIMHLKEHFLDEASNSFESRSLCQKLFLLITAKVFRLCPFWE